MGDFSHVQDNVLRREWFQRAHPAVEISHHEEPGWHWTAVWYDAGQRQEATRPELGDLLDYLDVVFG